LEERLDMKTFFKSACADALVMAVAVLGATQARADRYAMGAGLAVVPPPVLTAPTLNVAGVTYAPAPTFATPPVVGVGAPPAYYYAPRHVYGAPYAPQYPYVGVGTSWGWGWYGRPRHYWGGRGRYFRP
jgi:hypothetical protein